MAVNRYDVVVVGEGNAALSAAHSARERAERVLVLEKAPREWAGGNSYFTAGAIRTTYSSLADLRPLVVNVSDEEAAIIDLPPYTPADFMQDMERVTEGRCDRELTSVLVNEIADAMGWLHGKGMRFRLMYDRQSFEVDGQRRFWGNLPLGVLGGGQGMVRQHIEIAATNGIEIRYETPVVALLKDNDGGITGVRIRTEQGMEEIKSGAVVIAAGGFEADPQMRAAYLGPNWDVAKVRGTPYNTGEVLRMALDAGAQPYGNWSGCHAIQWDAGAPVTGDIELTNLLSRQSYPISIVVNREGRRFIDEGADFRNYTYAKYGAEVLKQPGAIAFQLYDGKTQPMLRQDEYAMPGISKYQAASIRELAEQIGVSPDTLETTVREFNAAIQPGEFNPAIKDGKRTEGILPPKSNWAVPLDSPPYLAFPVTCGITFTFGGIRITPDGAVLDRSNRPLQGLYAAGELVGGVFYHNYPGGSGLAVGAVFGRRAGVSAADYARQRAEVAH